MPRDEKTIFDQDPWDKMLLNKIKYQWNFLRVQEGYDLKTKNAHRNCLFIIH